MYIYSRLAFKNEHINWAQSETYKDIILTCIPGCCVLCISLGEPALWGLMFSKDRNFYRSSWTAVVLEKAMTYFIMVW